VAEPKLPKGPVAPAGAVEVAKVAPKPEPHYVQAYKARRKIPVWAMPMVASLPLWGFFYAGTLEPAPTTELTLLAEGEAEYAAVCSTCHGAAGGGGVGPQLSAGAVLQTFPDPVDQVRWVILGSANGPVNGQYGNGKPSVGGMPAYGGALDLELIVAAVLYERVALAGENVEDVAEEWTQMSRLLEDPLVATYGYTEEDFTEIVEQLAEEEGIELPEE
jgi:mono/diheme cytochrome c family protein